MDSVAELIAKAVREKAQPAGIPWELLKDDERQRWISGGEAALEVIWSLDRD